MMRLVFLFALSFSSLLHGQGNSAYWQQRADYALTVDVDVHSFTYNGNEKIWYTNNSPDTLSRVFYHMYFNAFQPGSEMDMRLQSIEDPDGRMSVDGKSRIAALKPNEIGFIRPTSLTQDGTALSYELEETVLIVPLAKPILPGEKTLLEMNFEGQVPVQIRRSGRNNREGVALSMSQWYPKIAEYDFEGWHADPYIAREFHGVWGDYDVSLTLDKDYVVGGTGYLQNPEEIGHGYTPEGVFVKKQKGKTLTWHFKAPMVHDFMWAADPEYVHDTLETEGGPVLHFFYKNNPEILENWKNLQPKTAEAMAFYSKNVGEYPYKQYSVIQGGDGGMEYGMSTLITGERSFESLVGVMSHEMAHSWFQFVLATNESKHEWMDEGFTSFISALCTHVIMGKEDEEDSFENSYRSYYYLATSGREQPLGTHADRYEFNTGYGISAYSKGSVFLSQLGYVIGQDNLMKTIRRYFDDFKFTHPTPNSILRSAEKVSGLELDWYLTDWTQTINTIDYSIAQVRDAGGKTEITLERVGQMPMPIDLLVVLKDGSQQSFYAPLRMMRGEKDNPYPQIPRTVVADWPWAQPTYALTVEVPLNEIQGIRIDPSGLMADINQENNSWLAD